MPFLNYKIRIGLKEVATVVAIPAVGALIAYFLWRRGTILPAKICRVEITVPGNKVSAVIGRKGSVVREIERTSGARVRVEAPPPTKDDAEEKDGVVVIQGSPENVSVAEMAVRKVIAKSPPVMIETLRVPKAAIGMIIGRKGANIQELSYLSGARLTIGKGEEEDDPEATVKIRGRPQAIDEAKMLLKDTLKRYQDSHCRPNGSECEHGFGSADESS